MAQNDTQTDTQNHGHGDSMTDPAQRAESVKSELRNIFEIPLIDSFLNVGFVRKASLPSVGHAATFY